MTAPASLFCDCPDPECMPLHHAPGAPCGCAPLFDLDPVPATTTARQEEPAMPNYTTAASIAEERRQDAEDTLAAEAGKLRDALAEAAGGGTTFGGLLGLSVAHVANKIAEAEAAHKVWTLAASILRGALDAGTPADPVRLFILLLDGPDDTWSGRGNDVRRAYADGVRRAVAEAVRLFR